MPQTLQTLLDAPIIELDTIDSTNNYAMQLIDADTAQAGMTIISAEQTQGKGQRGKQWITAPGESLLMSIICRPYCELEHQFLFNATIAVAVANFLTELYEYWDIRIKWPNDIIINDKKAGGILIENVLRGNSWSYSIIGLGLNILQNNFPDELPFATSLKLASGKNFNVRQIFEALRKNILQKTSSLLTADAVMREYNDYLFRRGCEQKFTDGLQERKGVIHSAASNGTLHVQLADGSILQYNHGVVQWKWE